MFNWLKPKTIEVEKVVHIVEPHMGERQLAAILKHVDRTKYRVGDTIETVAYRQGQIDLAHFIQKQIIGGKL